MTTPNQKWYSNPSNQIKCPQHTGAFFLWLYFRAISFLLTQYYDDLVPLAQISLMSGCGCGVGSGNTANKQKVDYQTKNNTVDIEGSFISGAGILICNIVKNVSASAIEAPNKLIFASNPCVAVGDSMVIKNLDLATCMKGLESCVKATKAPVKVGEEWVVEIDKQFTSNSGSNRLDLISSISTSLFCGTTGSTGKAMTIEVCGATPNVADFKGYIYTRPINSPPVIGAVLVSNGSSQVVVKGGGFAGKTGDKIELEQTAVTGANAATILSVASGRNANGEVITTMRLDRPVSGVTAAAPTGGGLPCVTASAQPQPIAKFVFTPKCGCCVDAQLDSAKTSLPSFPLGRRSDNDNNGCDAFEYCYIINISMPGSDTSYISGKLSLV